MTINPVLTIYNKRLEAENYPHRFLPLMGSGLYTDNSPPSNTCCRWIEEWNARHGAQVRIKTATLSEFFAHLEQNAGELPVFRGDWPDWWSDGVASAPVDTLLFRNAQRIKRQAERLDPAGRVMTPARQDQPGAVPVRRAYIWILRHIQPEAAVAAGVPPQNSACRGRRRAGKRRA